MTLTFDSTMQSGSSDMEHRAVDSLSFVHPFRPTPKDTEEVRSILEHKVPPELAIQIVSLGYNPWLVKRKVHEQEYYADYTKPNAEHCVAGLYLTTECIPNDGRRAIPQRIIFQTSAAYQGYIAHDGKDGFLNSHTRFDASILRPLSPKAERKGQDIPLEDVLLDTWWDPMSAADVLREKGWDFVAAKDGRIEWRVCNNSEAYSEYQDYRVEWGRDVQTEAEDDGPVGKGEGFLELLEPGFIVVLWVRTGLRCWCNKARAATIEIEYELP
ncbi:hypothetical protein GL218_03440 [Daldinia childiae]|uniref:uncharacterized protein n=1 Tax=Daldinia childiae TaxID=326645 RepID=UPI001446BF1A|nr:uncharacterized protein GL218_03440 [Daldinia childiae]KAF3061512.1 hypothetical protein GL218_03440 [Daldinia childiae]